jgi:hypothetical protein
MNIYVGKTYEAWSKLFQPAYFQSKIKQRRGPASQAPEYLQALLHAGQEGLGPDLALCKHAVHRGQGPFPLWASALHLTAGSQ